MSIRIISMAPVRRRPSSSRERPRSPAPNDRPVPPHRGQTNRTADLGLDCTGPSWPVPAAVHPIGMESLFASVGNRLLQQYRPEADIVSGWTENAAKAEA